MRKVNKLDLFGVEKPMSKITVKFYHDKPDIVWDFDAHKFVKSNTLLDTYINKILNSKVTETVCVKRVYIDNDMLKYCEDYCKSNVISI